MKINDLDDLNRFEKFLVSLVLTPIVLVALALATLGIILAGLGVLLLPILVLVSPDSVKFTQKKK